MGHHAVKIAGPSLLQLPDDVLGSIFELLSSKDRCSLMHVCRVFHSSDACLSKVCAL